MQNEGGCRQVPHLPRKVKVNVTKCHACHAKRRSNITKCHACHEKGRGDHGAKRDPSASPNQPSAVRATLATQSDGRCHQAPRLPRKATVDVTKCHACHAKRRSNITKCHACHEKSRGDHGAKRDPSASPEPAQCRSKCHACHAK